LVKAPVQDALARVGLNECWNSQSVSEDWFSRVRKSVSDAELEHQTEVLSEHSSLSLSEHFLLHCRGLVEHRLRFRAMLGSVLAQAGVAGQALLDHYDASTNSKPMAALAYSLEPPS